MRVCVYKAVYEENYGNIENYKTVKIASLDRVVLGTEMINSNKWKITKTNINPNSLGLHGTDFVTASGTYTSEQYTTETYEGETVYVINNDYWFNSHGIFVHFNGK